MKAIFFAAACLVAATAAHAQSYPSKTVRVIVPFAPGSVLDVITRLAGGKMSAAVGQPVIVDNRPGAGGRLGAELVARSAPDGYTMLFTSSGAFVGGSYLVKSLPYDPQKDFTPITAAVSPVDALILHPSLPVNSIAEFIEYARRNPGKLAYGSNGIGSTFHMVGEVLKQAAGIDMLHVPFQGAPQQTNAIMSGQIQVAFNSFGVSHKLASAGKVKLLAVMRDERYKGAPDVPAMKEGLPGYSALPNWFGFFGPGAMQPPLVSRINSELVKGLTAPDTAGKIDDIGMVLIASSAEQFASMVRSAHEAFAKAVKAAGLKPQ